MVVLRSPFFGSRSSRLGVAPTRPPLTLGPARKTGPEVPWSVPAEPFSRTVRPNSLKSNTTTRSASLAAARSSRNAFRAPDSSRSRLLCAKSWAEWVS